LSPLERLLIISGKLLYTALSFDASSVKNSLAKFSDPHPLDIWPSHPVDL
ncbi:24712_t:CDS:1, partial [Gigaspora rosea]